MLDPPVAWYFESDGQRIALQMVEDHVTEVQELQDIASGHCPRLQSFLERKSQRLVVLKIGLQTPLCTIQVLPCEQARTVRCVGVSFDDKTTRSVVCRFLRRVHVTRGNLTDSETEHSQELLSEVW
jgi:hypothetical protein